MTTLLEELTVCSQQGSKLAAERRKIAAEKKELMNNNFQKAEIQFEEYLMRHIDEAVARAKVTARKTGKILPSFCIDINWHEKILGYPVHVLMYGKQGSTWRDRTLFPSWNGKRPFKRIVEHYAPRFYIRDDSDPSKGFSPFVRIYTTPPPERARELWHDALDVSGEGEKVEENKENPDQQDKNVATVLHTLTNDKGDISLEQLLKAGPILKGIKPVRLAALMESSPGGSG